MKYIHQVTADNHKNNLLSDIYRYIYKKNKNYNENIYRTYFSEEEIKPENLRDSVGDKFVFLRSGEYYTDTFNLVGFAILKGCYTFRIVYRKTFSGYVLTGSYRDEKKGRWEQTRAELPMKVGDYKLYSGEFTSNTITVTFK